MSGPSHHSSKHCGVMSDRYVSPISPTSLATSVVSAATRARASVADAGKLYGCRRSRELGPAWNRSMGILSGHGRPASIRRTDDVTNRGVFALRQRFLRSSEVVLGANVVLLNTHETTFGQSFGTAHHRPCSMVLAIAGGSDGCRAIDDADFGQKREHLI